MSNSHNPQREAIRQLVIAGPLEPSILRGSEQRYFLDDREIYLMGVSEGKGHHSKEGDIAIMTLDPTSKNINVAKWLHCKGVVLRRKAFEGEFGDEIYPEQKDLCFVLEELNFDHQPIGGFFEKIHFHRSGRKIHYIQLVN